GSEEDDVSDTTPALDEAFERMAAASFELPNGFVNHGAMACEALAMLDCTGDIDSWARRFARAGGASVDPVVPAGFQWRQALGDYRRLAEWIGYFTQAMDEDGWPAVVAAWVPRLMPALRTALFHGAIRTAHAVRAIDAVDTAPRRGELARALGYWAARYREGQPAGPLPPAGDGRMALVRAPAHGARARGGARARPGPPRGGRRDGAGPGRGRRRPPLPGPARHLPPARRHRRDGRRDPRRPHPGHGRRRRAGPRARRARRPVRGHRT